MKIHDFKRQHHFTLISSIYALWSYNFLCYYSNYRSPNISYNKIKSICFLLWSNPFPMRTYSETSEKEIRTVLQKQGLAGAFSTIVAHYPAVPSLQETITLWWHKHYSDSAQRPLPAIATPPTCKATIFQLHKLLGKKSQQSLKHLSWLCLQLPKSHSKALLRV